MKRYCVIKVFEALAPCSGKRYFGRMVLVLGKNGQIAKSLSQLRPDFTYLSSAEAPFQKPDMVLGHLDVYRPNLVINAAAYTAVDKAEEERDLALQINATTPGLIAQWCAKNKATLVHFSTDYVFDGSGEKPWVETDQPNPINWYGQTKWDGEKQIQLSGCTHYIFRISWVYSEWGHNFRNTIRRLACEKKELRIVNDQWGAPTRATDVATSSVQLVQAFLMGDATISPGIYHLRYSPYMTWYDFALQIIADLKKEKRSCVVEKILPISSQEFPTPALRPANSRLGTLFPGTLGAL